jgi:hypothetical protein
VWFSLIFCFILPVKSKYYAHQLVLVLRHPHSIFYCQKPSSLLMQNNTLTCSSIYFNLYVFSSD